MRPLKIVMGEDEPSIYANGQTGEIDFGGRILTYFETLTDEYLVPFTKWLEEFSSQNISDTLTLNLRFTYFNTSAEKVLLFPVFKLLEEHKAQYNNVKVNWFYQTDDDGMLDTGEIFQSITELDFTLIPVDSE